jgi:hypothetical protein
MGFREGGRDLVKNCSSFEVVSSLKWAPTLLLLMPQTSFSDLDRESRAALSSLYLSSPNFRSGIKYFLVFDEFGEFPVLR